MLRFISSLAILTTLVSCQTSAPHNAKPVTGFEVDRYLGTWYEIARLDHRFERGLTHITAEYTKNDDGTIAVKNRGYKAADSTWSEATGKAKFAGDTNVGQLKVSFFGPFYGGYNIIELAQDYSHALVAGPDTSYLWILARKPKLDPAVQQKLIDKAKSLGFNTESLIYVDHTSPTPES